MKNKTMLHPSGFEKMASIVTKVCGSTSTFVIALCIIIAWLISGPLFHYSDTWQLIINTSTTIITFLMVFLIQRSQNKDSLAIHLKLNELIAAHEYASNRLVSVEDISEEELKVLQIFFKELAAMTKNELSLHQSHSIDEVYTHHKRKHSKVKSYKRRLSEK